MEPLPTSVMAQDTTAVEQPPMTTTGLLQAESVESASQTFDTFHPFPRLATEIRLKIYLYAAYEPRYVEVLGCPIKNPESMRYECESGSFRVANHSQRAPAVLQISRESRLEAEKVYNKIFYAAIPEKKEKREGKKAQAGGSRTQYSYTYFNPDIDSLLFNEHICRHQMVRLFEGGDQFSRVILLVHDDPKYYSDRCQKSLEILRALHGGVRDSFNSQTSHFISQTGNRRDSTGRFGDNYGLGCKGLQEISVVVRSDIWDIPNHLIDPQLVSFRTLQLPGRTAASIDYSQYFESDFQATLRNPSELELGSPEGVEVAGESWHKGAPPSLQVVNLAPHPSVLNPRHLDSIILGRYFYDLLITTLDRNALDDFAERTKCFLFTKQVIMQEKQGRKGEIGLYGINQAIDNAKKEVKGMLLDLISRTGVGLSHGYESPCLAITNRSAEIEKEFFGLPTSALFPAGKSPRDQLREQYEENQAARREDERRVREALQGSD